MDIEEIKAIRVKKGDVITVKFDRPMTGGIYTSCERILKEIFPNNRSIILERGIEIEIIRPEKEVEDV